MSSSKKKLNIAFVVSAFPTVSETFIVNQICDLIDRGHEITIFSFEKNNEKVIHKKILDYELLDRVVYYAPNHTSKLKRYLPFLKFLFFYAKDLDRTKLFKNFNFFKNGRKGLNLQFFYKYYWILQYGPFNVLHAHFGPNGAYVAGMKASGFFKKTGFVCTFHGYDLNPKLLPDFKTDYAELLQQADFLTVNSKYTESLVKKISNRAVEVLPVGLDIHRFKTEKRNHTGPCRIIFIGRLIALKGPHLALEILRILKERGFYDISLIIVGEGEMYNELQRLINEYGLENQVQLKGALTQEKLVLELSSSHIFLLPGIYDINNRAESQGLVVQEAQAMELPVVVSDAGGMKYGLIDRETGFVVGEKQIKEFADKIEYLIVNTEKRIEMGKKARAFVEQNYDSKILGDRLESIYEKCLK